MTIQEIATILQATCIGTNNNAIIKQFATDTRKIIFANETVFFAFNTNHNNGHLYIPEAYEKGVRLFVIDHSFSIPANLTKACFLQVENTLLALQQLAAFHRSSFSFPIIGITGSNGKTIVKEWLYTMLQNKYNIVRSPRSYNSQIGVPLSVLAMQPQHNLGIFEAGISTTNEMQQLQQIIQPKIGILTTIGNAHNEGFNRIEQKLTEKLILFKNADVLIYNADTVLPIIDIEQHKHSFFSNKNIELIGFSANKNSAVHYKNNIVNGVNIIALQYKNSSYTFYTNLQNKASTENIVCCITLLLHLNCSEDYINKQLQSVQNIAMRLQLKKAINNCYLIDDSYSNDVSSLSIALQYLQQQADTSNKTVILSDILETGMQSEKLYTQVAALLKQHNIQHFIGIGTQISQHKNLFIQQNCNCTFFKTTQEFLQQAAQHQFNNTYILLKGARIFQFEKIANWFDDKVHNTVLEINLSAMAANLRLYQNLVKPSTKIMAMVKAFSYGSGSIEVARLLQFYKVQYLAVAYTDEGIELRKAGIHIPIMVLNADESAFDALVQYNLEPEVYSFTMYTSLHNYLQNQGIQQFPIHVKINTGMNRLGFNANEIELLATHIYSNKTCKVQTVFSHLAASENAAFDSFTIQQAAIFNEACSTLQSIVAYSFIQHVANTSAIARHTQLQYNMVRLGIGLYGVNDGNNLPLQTVATLKTTIAQIRKVQEGETVGYGRKGVITKPSTIATIRIGYADGYSRQNSNGIGKVWLHNQLAPVIGNVCMDMTMIDITHIEQAAEGDMVEIFGNNININTVANNINTIAYEVLTSVSQRVKRVYIQE
jgi:Alr-MurF fusion protein